MIKRRPQASGPRAKQNAPSQSQGRAHKLLRRAAQCSRCRYFRRHWCQEARADQARPRISIKANIVERVECKPPQNRTARSRCYAYDWVDEFDVVALFQL